MTPEYQELSELVRNTRRWVMAIAWIVITQVTLAICFGAAAGLQIAKANHDRANAPAYAACIVAGNSADFCHKQG